MMTDRQTGNNKNGGINHFFFIVHLFLREKIDYGNPRYYITLYIYSIIRIKPNQTKPNVNTQKMSETTKIVKTLPIKYKHILYSMVGLVEQFQRKSILDEESLQKCLDVFKPVIFMKPNEQVTFLDEFIDVQHIEKNIVKEMIIKQKKTDRDKEMAPIKAEKAAEKTRLKIEKAAEKAALTEKLKDDVNAKPKAKRKPKPKAEATAPKTKIESETETETESNCKSKSETETETKIESETETETESNCKSKSETETETKIESETESNCKSKSEMEPESDPESNCKSKPETDPEMTMKIINDVRYWILDSDLNNGFIYENTTDDNGDSTNGMKVGELKHGVLFLDTIEPIKTKKTVKNPRKANPEKPKKVEKETKMKGRKPMITETMLEGTIDIPTSYDEFSLKEDFTIDKIYTSELTEEIYSNHENRTITNPKIKINQ